MYDMLIACKELHCCHPHCNFQLIFSMNQQAYFFWDIWYKNISIAIYHIRVNNKNMWLCKNMFITRVNDMLAEKGSRFLTGETLCCFDCELMPKLQHVRVAGEFSPFLPSKSSLLSWQLPNNIILMQAHAGESYPLSSKSSCWLPNNSILMQDHA